MLLYFVENLGHDKTITIPGRGQRVDVGICLSIKLIIFNQKQLENVLEFITLGLPFTSVIRGWLAGIHSQSATNLSLNMLKKLQCIKIESNGTHNFRDMEFQKITNLTKILGANFVSDFMSEQFSIVGFTLC